MARSGSREIRLLLTCEHGGNRLPREHRALFRGAAAALASHRGWDPGALTLARMVGRRLGLAVMSVTWSRLLVESNRAPHNPRIWSTWTRPLPRVAKLRILERYWWPHRRRVEAAVRSAALDGAQVWHIAVHSFTPVLDGVERNAEVGLLYDSARPAERKACARWAALLRELIPGLRVRLNYPYLGSADGLATWLRHRFPARVYLGVELEANQALLAGPRQPELARALADSLRTLSVSMNPPALRATTSDER